MHKRTSRQPPLAAAHLHLPPLNAPRFQHTRAQSLTIDVLPGRLWGTLLVVVIIIAPNNAEPADRLTLGAEPTHAYVCV